MAFSYRSIDVEITLKEGFFQGSENKITLTGHRVNCLIRNPGGYSSGTMQCAIFGLSERLMNQLTGIGVIQTQNIGNEITIITKLIDRFGKKDIAIAFKGWIAMAWADFNNQPDAMLNIVAQGGYPFYTKPVEASSFQGEVSAATIMRSFAKEQGYELQDYGVQHIFYDYTFNGNTIDKIQECARAGDFNYIIDDVNSKLVIYPHGVTINEEIPLISSETGMIGYPTFNENGVMVQCLYNKNIKEASQVQIKSSLPTATGKFSAFDIMHTIESENNQGSGAWYTNFMAFRLNDKPSQ